MRDKIIYLPFPHSSPKASNIPKKNPHLVFFLAVLLSFAITPCVASEGCGMRSAPLQELSIIPMASSAGPPPLGVHSWHCIALNSFYSWLRLRQPSPSTAISRSLITLCRCESGVLFRTVKGLWFVLPPIISSRSCSLFVAFSTIGPPVFGIIELVLVATAGCLSFLLFCLGADTCQA